MKILHYSLGFPPYRTGGLTKFCMDLMKQQVSCGHKVALLWPGEMSLVHKQTKIRCNKAVEGIQSWEVINPNPISYDEGIQKTNMFTMIGDYECYENFLQKIRPDIIHVHTLMGLHKSFLDVSKKMGIRLVFSAHDLFPICPKVTMFRHGQVCRDASDCEACTECNATALDIWKIKLLQSKIYREIKDCSIIKKLRKEHRDNYLSGESEEKVKRMLKSTTEDYLDLRRYYISLLDYMNIIHYNSTVTKNVYETYLGKRKSVVISITHSDVKDKRKEKHFSEDKLKITYLGPYSGAKGFFLLKEALDELWMKQQNFCLNVFFQMKGKSPYIKTNERYNYSELEHIFDETDVLVVPSIWYETFGYTALEAISYGVPVVLTSNVGAKDIVPTGAGIIVEDICVDGLKNALEGLTIDNLKQMNRIILEKAEVRTIECMCLQIEQECYKGEYR